MGGPAYTLYLFGSSVPWGFPYAPRCSIGTIVAQMWSGSVGGADLVLRNEAQYGAPSRFALERIRSVTQRTHAANSALALVYSGNNEFLHLSPGRGSAQGRGPALMTPDERTAIVDHHRANLEAGILALRHSGIDVVLATIPVNLRDWPPTYSVLDDDPAGRIASQYSRAADAARTGRTGEAELLLQQLLHSHEEFAQAHFLLGRLYLAAGRTEEALAHLVAANDFDGRPLRATTAINRNIRTLASTYGVRLLDAEAAFTTAAADGICGRGQFWDDCHPKLDGYIRIAGLLSSHIADVASAGAPPPVPEADDVQRHHGIDEPFLADIHGRIGLYYYKHSNCWDSALTLELAEEHLRRALSMSPSSIEVHVALALVLARLGEQEPARELAAAAIGLDRQRALWLLHGRETRDSFKALGVTDVAQWALGRASAS